MLMVQTCDEKHTPQHGGRQEPTPQKSPEDRGVHSVGRIQGPASWASNHPTSSPAHQPKLCEICRQVTT